ncbi:hypothetical protein [Planctobacterium marinum]|uniref:Uncharacterized protein n=1 Tax=Planctobacterium marinum TaxID=1631968 RepID=A0AA48HLF6_9ALTE|nr:hypothetical protein MACH26_29250 [Planctobacterium marinum]
MENPQNSVPDSTHPPQDDEPLRLPLKDKSFTSFSKIKLKLNELTQPLRLRFKRLSDWFNGKFKDLSFSQWCYFLAAIMLLNFLSEPQDDEDYWLVVGVIAGVGLLRELWQTFMRIWEHTLGKGVLFVLYASTANIALAVSALKINSISGIEPQTFVFTMGFTTMLMLPFWLLLASVFFLGSAIVLLSLWSSLSFILRIFRIKLKTHWEDKSFAVLTMWMRIFFIPFLMVVLFKFLEPYAEQINVFDDFNPTENLATLSQEELLNIASAVRNQEQVPLTEEQQALINESGLSTIEIGMLRNMSEQDLADLSESVQSGQLGELIRRAQTEDKTTEDAKVFSINFGDRDGDTSSDSDTNSSAGTTSANSTAENADAETEKEDEEAKERSRTLDKLIASFIYQFEAYRYSACRKEANQRVLTIDENTIFVVEKDKTQELGYKFSVAACVPQWADE